MRILINTLRIIFMLNYVYVTRKVTFYCALILVEK